MASRGTKFVRVSVINQLLEALRGGKKRLAVVGTPCQIRVVRKLELGGYLRDHFPEAEVTLIGLFCFESFDHLGLKKHLQDTLAVDLDEAERIQITRGRFSIFIGGEERSCNISDLEDYVKEGCRFCNDFTSRLADISVGSVGSPEGYSTVIIRSDRGRRLLEAMEGSEMGVAKKEIAKLSAIKRRRAEKQFNRIIDGSGMEEV